MSALYKARRTLKHRAMTPCYNVEEITVKYSPSIKNNEPIFIKSSQDCYTHLRPFFCSDTLEVQEQFLVMYLNHRKKVIGVYRLSKGGITVTVADIRLVLSVALKTLATSIVISHNHPSGNPNPSMADIKVTMKFKQACEIMEIELIDHLVVTQGEEFYSFKDNGIM